MALLLAMMPIQLWFAAVGSYCRHESGAAARHVGHHDHRHHDASASKDVGKEKGSTPTLQADADCGACHLNAPGATAALIAFVTAGIVIGETALRRPSPSIFPPEPERPKWAPTV
ncbi:MAG: hypothetical protein EYC67_12945 [Betaproteobacteria bacterium]|nr:MAG: hypothetical protein EYC67_12945 [Betaproteobacteria bacterium]